MNTEQITGGLRLVIGYALAYVAGKGWISHDDVVQLAPLLVAICVAGYGIWRKRDAGLLQTAKENVKGLEEVKIDTSVATPAVAAIALSSKPENANVKPV